MTSKLFMKLCATVVMVGSMMSAHAGDTIIWRGWTDFGSCNRVKWYKDDLGIRWPTNESVGQTVSAEIYLARTVDEIAKNRLMSCALKGVIAAGSTALITSGASAWPAFKVTFDACLTSEGLVQFLTDNISIRHESKCNW
jgi:hypothetical protein